MSSAANFTPTSCCLKFINRDFPAKERAITKVDFSYMDEFKSTKTDETYISNTKD